MARSSDRSKERRWIRLLQEKQVSGESVAACCRKRQIPAHQFYWWQRQLRHRDAQDTDEQPLSPASFVPVRVSLVEPMIEVVHAGGCIVRVVAGVDDLRKGSRCRSAAVRPSHRPFTVSPSPVAKREQQRTSSRQRTNPDGLQFPLATSGGEMGMPSHRVPRGFHAKGGQRCAGGGRGLDVDRLNPPSRQDKG